MAWGRRRRMGALFLSVSRKNLQLMCMCTQIRCVPWCFAVTDELAKGIDAAWRLAADAVVGNTRQQLLELSLDASE